MNATTNSKRIYTSTRMIHNMIMNMNMILILLLLFSMNIVVVVHASSSSNIIMNTSCSINPISIGMRSAMTSSSLPFLQRFSSCNDKSNSNRSRSCRRRRGGGSFSAHNDVHTTSSTHTISRGGGNSAATATSINTPSSPTTTTLNFYENMICGAISRSVAQIATHPANTMKTLLQSNRSSSLTASSTNKLTLSSLAKLSNVKMLTRGAGAQLILSIPHGAVNFAVLEYVRSQMNVIVNQSSWATKQKQKKNKLFGPMLDFCSSAVATVCCSVVSTPQMMIVDNIMAGTYPNLVMAVRGLSSGERGVMGFYSGW